MSSAKYGVLSRSARQWSPSRSLQQLLPFAYAIHEDLLVLVEEEGSAAGAVLVAGDIPS